MTAVLTTVISFLPVFTMEAAEGKLFKPLAYTKTFALIGSIVVALTIIPPLAHWVLGGRFSFKRGLASIPEPFRRFGWIAFNIVVALLLAVWLAGDWKPLGPEYPAQNLVFVVLSVGGLLGFFHLIIHFYGRILAFLLRVKTVFLVLCLLLVAGGFSVWRGLGKEFMPDLDEGSFLLMPTTMPHASIGEVMDVLKKQDMAINAIPEVESVVGKLGRVDSPLDPAPVSMIETLITYKPEFITDEEGRLVRQWRDEIKSPEDIWQAIVAAATIPGTTSAPKLQPIAARIVMLQSGMRAPMGLKVYGPDLQTIEQVALEIEGLLKQVPAIKAEAVLADRIVGKPYLEIEIDRDAIARYGIRIAMVQDVIEVAIGGKPITQTVEGRERYPVRVRYLRELRDTIESIGGILVAAPDGTQIPLREIADINYVRGPQMIKSEDTFLVGYVIFDKRPGQWEVDVVEEARAFLEHHIESGDLVIPAGVSYKFTGSYENQVRAEKKLMIVLPLALFSIWLILYFQFRRLFETLIVFSGILFAWSGGFILVWMYGQPWFMDFALFGHNLRELFQIGTINLSVAVWVGFLALFGIATDDGVLVCTYLQQVFRKEQPASIEAIRSATLQAGKRRVRPAMMTSATTILALLPVLTSTGRGSDIMVPMAIPSFGGMMLAILTIFVVPVLYCWFAEAALRLKPAR